jgi:hypothetical protein
MITMNIPGFTAEASLSGASEHYQTLGSSAAQAAGGVVLPQQFRTLYDFCHTDMEGRITECCACYRGTCLCDPAKKKPLVLFPRFKS